MCMENQSVLPRGIKPAGGTGELQATKRWASNKAGSVLPRGIKPAGGTVWGTPPQAIDWGTGLIVQVFLQQSSANRELELAEQGGEQGGNVTGALGA